MKVLVYGEYWPGTLASLLETHFRQAGHQVRVFNFCDRLFRARRPSLVNRALDRVLAARVAGTINRDFKSALAASDPDVVIVSKGLHLESGTVADMAKQGRVICNWNPDDFFNPRNSNARLLESFPLYDSIVTARKHLADEYRRRGAKLVHYLDWYYDPALHFPVTPTAEELAKYGAAVSFVGSWSEHREAIIGALAGLPVKIWGAGWERSSALFQKTFTVTRQSIDPEAYRKVISCSLINLNVLTVENRDFTNLKNFEIPAAGGFQITNRNASVQELFVEGKEVACYGDPQELREACHEYLGADARRREMARAGHRRVLGGHHAFSDRMKDLSAHVQGMLDQRGPRSAYER